MDFSGVVYFEAKTSISFEIKQELEECLSKLDSFGILKAGSGAVVSQVNYSWDFEDENMAIVNLKFVTYDEQFGLLGTESILIFKKLIRDILEIGFTTKNITPAYVEDIELETDECINLNIPDFYMLSTEEFNDKFEDKDARKAWANFKRSDDFLTFVNRVLPAKSVEYSSTEINVIRQELKAMRETASNVKYRFKKTKRENKHLLSGKCITELEERKTDNRKIFILE